jgi:transcriptional regulator with XRE-family HTH domain
VGTSPPSRQSLGDFIRDRRQSSRLSLRDLATRSRVSNAYISQIERGLHQPSIRVLRSIADALELTSEQMMIYAGLTPSSVERSAGTAEVATDTERAIGSDPRLSDADRATLLAHYRRLAGIERATP